jgi:CheY-like chemotaxis protein
MVVGSSESALASPPAALPERIAPSTTVPSILLIPEPDTRLLLKGLLRLHRHPVVFEADGIADLARLPPSPEPKIALVEVDLADPNWTDALGARLAERPDVRAVLVTTDRSPRLGEQARAAGCRAVLVRPFQIRDLVGALDAAARAHDGPA